MKFNDFFKDQNINQDNKLINDQETPIEPDATIKIIKIATPDEAQRPAKELKNGNAVIVDCTGLNANNKTRAYDFLTGACFMNGSQMATIAPQIYLLTPTNIRVASDSDDIERIKRADDSQMPNDPTNITSVKLDDRDDE